MNKNIIRQRNLRLRQHPDKDMSTQEVRPKKQEEADIPLCDQGSFSIHTPEEK